MNAIRRFLGLFRDSPTYGRDRAALLTGFSIGTAGLLLNGAVLLLVLPLMVDPDDRDFRMLTENLEFGQLLALILLGGATAFATLLIPFRLLTVFWGPRIGRYFDQVVLSGVTPLKFVIGKALSQNLLLALALCLLLPYLVLSLTLGGVDVQFFVVGLFLLWLYCMALALVTLWMSLYLNELLAAVLINVGATIVGGLGCIPLPVQPFVVTPLPVLLHPVYASIPALDGQVPESFAPLFIASVSSLAAVIGVALFAIHLGPLFGIIRENSTFGEVVRAGDSKRRRWSRLRPHIQRPSEIAFFYENRSAAFRRHEGLLRWGLGLCGLLLVSAVAYALFLKAMSIYVAGGWGGRGNWWVYEFHACCLSVHGCGLVLAALLFSHSKNSTYLRLPVVLGWKVEVSRLDTAAFLLFALCSTAASAAVPYWFDQFCALPNGATVFPDGMSVRQGMIMDYARIAAEGTAVISVAGLVVYAFQRLACLTTWLKSATFVGIGALYFIVVCMIPAFFAMLFLDVPELREVSILAEGAPVVGMTSPFMVFLHLFHELGPRFPSGASTAPFYVSHGVLLSAALFEIRRRGRKLRTMYLAGPVRETN